MVNRLAFPFVFLPFPLHFLLFFTQLCVLFYVLAYFSLHAISSLCTQVLFLHYYLFPNFLSSISIPIYFSSISFIFFSYSVFFIHPTFFSPFYFFSFSHTIVCKLLFNYSLFSLYNFFLSFYMYSAILSISTISSFFL